MATKVSPNCISEDFYRVAYYRSHLNGVQGVLFSHREANCGEKRTAQRNEITRRRSRRAQEAKPMKLKHKALVKIVYPKASCQNEYSGYVVIEKLVSGRV